MSSQSEEKENNKSKRRILARVSVRSHAFTSGLTCAELFFVERNLGSSRGSQLAPRSERASNEESKERKREVKKKEHTEEGEVLTWPWGHAPLVAS